VCVCVCVRVVKCVYACLCVFMCACGVHFFEVLPYQLLKPTCIPKDNALHVPYFTGL